MNKQRILEQDLAAVTGNGDGVPWIKSRSKVSLGQGPGVLPMIGIPDDVIEELRAETASVAAIVPSQESISDLLTTRIWAYFIRRANGQTEHRVTVVDPCDEGTTVEAVSVIADECLGEMSAWLFEQWIKPKAAE